MLVGQVLEERNILQVITIPSPFTQRLVPDSLMRAGNPLQPLNQVQAMHILQPPIISYTNLSVIHTTLLKHLLLTPRPDPVTTRLLSKLVIMRGANILALTG